MLIFSNVLYSCSLRAAFNTFLRYNKDGTANVNIIRKYTIIYNSTCKDGIQVVKLCTWKLDSRKERSSQQILIIMK